MNCCRRCGVRPGVVFGSIAIVLGVVLLLRNFGFLRGISIDVPPLLLMAFGLVNLLGCSTSSGRVWGALLALAGGYWLASNLGLAPYRFRDIWPAFLVLLGLYFLWRALTNPSASAGHVSRDTINEMVVFGGGKRTVTSQQFRGGEVYALFGGNELNLRGAEIDGASAVIDATAICGGVELRVPESWDVSMEGVAILGGYEDKTSHPPAGDSAKRLVIRGFAVFGGVEVKN